MIDFRVREFRSYTRFHRSGSVKDKPADERLQLPNRVGIVSAQRLQR